MQSGDLAHVWIGTTAGDLVRADSVIGLACTGGSVDAFCCDGRILRLAESGCPADSHLQLLELLGRARSEDRWIQVISPETSRDGSLWTRCRVEDLTGPGSKPQLV